MGGNRVTPTIRIESDGINTKVFYIPTGQELTGISRLEIDHDVNTGINIPIAKLTFLGPEIKMKDIRLEKMKVHNDLELQDLPRIV